MGRACMGQRRGVYRVLVGKPEGKRPLGRPRHRWEDNINMDLQEVGFGGMGWIDLAQDRDRWQALVNAVMNLWVPWNAGTFLTSWELVSFSRMPLLQAVRVGVDDKLKKKKFNHLGAKPQPTSIFHDCQTAFLYYSEMSQWTTYFSTQPA